MLNKVTPLLRAAPRLQQVRFGHGVPAHWKTLRQISEETKSHMNFMPVPQGSWQEAYKAKSAKANILLAASVAAFISTYALLWKSGVIYLHSAPPMYNSKKA
ncbi:unnamed protein product [Lymnaea stagnalis]|uniref:Deltamethrin resistance protein prag01 domain-containing protein n=1 Tax=Lymnaea stagnalis TaxID=6523 RepID=A0AAV2I4Q2_LYMST